MPGLWCQERTGDAIEASSIMMTKPSSEERIARTEAAMHAFLEQWRDAARDTDVIAEARVFHVCADWIETLLALLSGDEMAA